MIVAFLQNCYFKHETPNYIIDKYLSDPDYRRKLLANSATGKRLVTAFGEKFKEIHWDNASKYVANYAAGKAPPDVEHMADVLITTQAKVALAFGNVAADGLQIVLGPASFKDNCVSRIPWHFFMHPMAFGLTQAQLNEFAQRIISQYMS